MEKLLTVREVAEAAQVNHKTVRAAVHDGSLPALRFGKASNAPMRFRQSAVDAWLATLERQHAPSPAERAKRRRKAHAASAAGAVD